MLLGTRTRAIEVAAGRATGVRVERDGLEHQFSTIFDQVLAYGARKPINVHNPEVVRG